MSAIPHLAYLNISKKIWREIKRPFKRKFEAIEKIHGLQPCRNEANTFFGAESDISRCVDAELKFWRWAFILGSNFAERLHVRKHSPETLDVFTRHIGINLENEIRVTDEGMDIDGIKIPRECAGCLTDIVFPSYLRREYESFEHYCTIIGNNLSDFHEGPYEYGNVCLAEGDVVFDCGAHKGLFSAVASRYGCQVFAFEAIPAIIDNYLSKTAKMNRNICVCNFATWHTNGTLEFVFNSSADSASKCNQLRSRWTLLRNKLRSPQACTQFTVPAITLDAFVERNNIERVDFIKADIEGAERNMLRGATRILREFAPKLSICTYHLPDDPQVLREIILEANPKYQIVEKFKKMYAHVP